MTNQDTQDIQLAKDGHQTDATAVGQTRTMVATAWKVAEH